ncbi:hypothetical protein Q5424_01970 [Conexibacter sp. JD483]|uniref:hypothetical protein n=1 Tax=unclassified Conexibacter TaxID=2627773 RepID=UPI0027284C4A|nr:MULTISPECIES: hypothetical protein [unclassified Conexibacter]MDO8185651.1 hypothetical protein [Conexibacter sp. CPCC 205706]MDO8198824.1 hypothetical protein [Conexibacter sp. CPCC 205762]MDR9367826.1 hypothetical protein [Conexibacter sp. JD483]
MESSTGTVIRGLCAALAAALPAFAAADVAAAAKADPASCSVRGLSPSRHEDGVTYAVTVSKLRADGASCRAARSLARRAAVALLDRNRVPRRIGDYTLRSQAPCAGCTPQRTVTATAPGRRVTFVLFG